MWVRSSKFHMTWLVCCLKYSRDATWPQWLGTSFSETWRWTLKTHLWLAQVLLTPTILIGKPRRRGHKLYHLLYSTGLSHVLSKIQVNNLIKKWTEVDCGQHATPCIQLHPVWTLDTDWRWQSVDVERIILSFLRLLVSCRVDMLMCRDRLSWIKDQYGRVNCCKEAECDLFSPQSKRLRSKFELWCSKCTGILCGLWIP